MNKKIALFIIFCITHPVIHLLANPVPGATSSMVSGDYSIVIQGYDWGPAVSKVILSMDKPISGADSKAFTVAVKRSTELTELTPQEASGTRTVLYAYVSDEKGNRVSEGSYTTLVLLVGPDMVLGSPIKYIRQDNSGANHWIDYKLTVTDSTTQMVWDTETGRSMPLIDSFDLLKNFTDSNGITMSYAFYSPDTSAEKSPLIIWLHGGGEGGTDPGIPIIANRAANYASDDIQAYFGGAYVLAPQCPGAWMHNKEGVTTHGREDDIYNKGLMELINGFVASHRKIDTDRIYVGGCSNGGYMALKLILQHPDYFAAGFISALAYQSRYITDGQIQEIKDVPIWFVHSKDDQTTLPENTVIPVYKRLIEAGAQNVHFSYYDHVIDLSGFYGGDDYFYNGHWSWIYSHANHAKLDFDGNPVLLDTRPVTIMEWMAAQSK